MARQQPRVAFVGPSDSVDRALVVEAGGQLVDDVRRADVVHVTGSGAEPVDAIGDAVAAGRSVVVHEVAGLLDGGVVASLVAGAAEAGVVVAVPFVHRYYPMVRLGRRRVLSGAPGPLHLLHGWSMVGGLAAWTDLVEFVSGHRIVRLVASGVAASRLDPDDEHETPGAVGVLFETDHGAAGNVAVSSTRAVDGGTLFFRLDGVEESLVFHEGRAEVLDVIGGRSTQRFQRGVGAEVSRYSTQPTGHPQGSRGCWTAFVSDVYAAVAGASPHGLPGLEDLARSAALVDSVRRAETDGRWHTVTTVSDLLVTTEGRSA